MGDTIRKDIATIDINKPLRRESCGVLLAVGDEYANRFGAHIVRNGATVDVSGCTVSGFFIRADGVTVPLEGVAEGNTVYVDLSASCYTCDGTFTLALKISGEGFNQTVRMVDGYIRRTDTGSVAPDEETVFAIEQLKALKLETERVLAETNQALAQFGAPDWSVNDEAQPGYVKNRTHWKETGYEERLAEQTFELVAGEYFEYFPDAGNGEFVVYGEDVSVVWDGIRYPCRVNNSVEVGGTLSGLHIGNPTVYRESATDSGEPFCLVWISGANVLLIIAATSGTHTVAIDRESTSYKKMAFEYLPNSNIMNGSGEFSICTRDGMSTDRATGSGAIALGPAASATELYAMALNGTASGVGSVAICQNSIASGATSVSIGSSSESRGRGACAVGFYTIATAEGQCAVGKYNVVDTANKYSFIAGNGVQYNKRSNAFTVDQAGTGWFQGRPQFGGTEQDNGAQTVMGNGDAEIILASPSGALFGITVSDNGTLTVAAK